MSRSSALLLAVLSVACLAGCATTATAKRDPRDPFERVNRGTYAFNSAVDRALLRPTARVYHKITPDPVETGVSNFFDNLEGPLNIVSNL